MYFKLKMIPPTATAQQKGEMIIRGRIHHYKKRNVAAAEAILRDALLPYIPKEPITDKPIQLWVIWEFPYPKSAKKHKPGWGRWKITRPDTDNLNKMLKDVMTDMGFWKDDALICSEIVEKLYTDEPGIMIHIGVLDPDLLTPSDGGDAGAYDRTVYPVC